MTRPVRRMRLKVGARGLFGPAADSQINATVRALTLDDDHSDTSGQRGTAGAVQDVPDEPFLAGSATPGACGEQAERAGQGAPTSPSCRPHGHVTAQQ